MGTFVAIHLNLKYNEKNEKAEGPLI
jgi:hypothetical protein